MYVDTQLLFLCKTGLDTMITDPPSDTSTNNGGNICNSYNMGKRDLPDSYICIYA